MPVVGLEAVELAAGRAVVGGAAVVAAGHGTAG